jgi:hypothetical protein
LNCDPNTLSKAASCLFCGLSEYQLNLARIRTLCAWAGVAGGSVVAPGAPTNPDISDASFEALTFVTWTNPATPGTTNEVWKSADGITFALFTTVGGGITQASDATVLGVGQFAYYKIRSCNGASCSAFSSVVSAVNTYTSPNVAAISFPTLVQAYGGAASFKADGLAALTSVSLPKLRRVVNTLDLANNPNLTVITLTALATVGGALFLGSNKITGAFSLPALLSVGADLQFQSNTLLTSFSAPLLNAVNGNLVGRNVALTSVNFNSLQTIGGGGFPGALDFAPSVALTTLSFPALTNVNGDIIFNGSTVLTSVSFPALTSTNPTNLDTFNGNGCTLLSSFSIPNLIFTDGFGIEFTGDALNAASINQILARGVASALAGTDFELAGGTNAAPSGQGIVDKAALIVAGNAVNTN